MTMPAEPGTGTTGAPETGGTSTEQQPTGTQTETGSGTGTGAEGTDWSSMFEGMTPEEVKEKLDHSRTWEKRAKANKAKLDQLTAEAGKATGTTTSGEPSDQHAKELEDERKARAAADERARQAVYNAAVSRIAPKVGADAEALLDSGKFRRAVDAEAGDDADDEDLAAAVEKVAKKFAKEARFAGTRPTPPRGSGEFGGSPGTGTPITEEQLAQMTPDQVAKAYTEGKLKHLL